MRFKSILYSIISQFFSSGTTFFVNIYLVREMTTSAYGAYTLSFLIMLFLNGVFSAYLITPMIVHISSEKNKLIHYYTLFIQIILLYLLLSLGINLIYWSLDIELFSLSNHEAFVVIAASCVSTLKELNVRYSFSSRDGNAALATNGSSFFLVILGLCYLHYTNIAVSIESIFIVYIISYTICNIIGGYFNEINIFDLLKYRKNKTKASNNIWSALNFAVYFMKGNSYNFVVNYLIGSIGVAKANAVKVFVSPFIMFMPAISNVFLPAISREQNKNKKLILGLRASMTISFIALTYSLIIILTPEKIILSILTDKYKNYQSILILHSIVMVFSSGRNCLELTYQSMNKYTELFNINILISSLALAASILGCTLLDIEGALLGLLFGEALIFIILFKNIYKQINRDENDFNL